MTQQLHNVVELTEYSTAYVNKLPQILDMTADSDTVVATFSKSLENVQEFVGHVWMMPYKLTPLKTNTRTGVITQEMVTFSCCNCSRITSMTPVDFMERVSRYNIPCYNHDVYNSCHLCEYITTQIDWDARVSHDFEQALKAKIIPIGGRDFADFVEAYFANNEHKNSEDLKWILEDIKVRWSKQSEAD